MQIIMIRLPVANNIYLGFDESSHSLFVKVDAVDDLSGIERISVAEKGQWRRMTCGWIFIQ